MDFFLSSACAYKKYKLCLYKALHNENAGAIRLRSLRLKSWTDLYNEELQLLCILPYEKGCISFFLGLISPSLPQMGSS